MPDPFADRDLLDVALELAASHARRYLERVGDEHVLKPGTGAAIGQWSDPMPEDGVGTLTALTELAERARETATRSSGPRFFHFVMGGGTPAALAADWLTSAYDQVAFGWASSPLAARLEQVALDWLRAAVRAAGDFGRRADDRRHDGELRRAGGGAQLVGERTASTSTRTAWPGCRRAR